MKKRILHILSGTASGAELQLVRLFAELNRDEFEFNVITLGREPPLANDMRSLGISVQSLSLKQKPWQIGTLYQYIHRYNPHVLHLTMNHAYLLGAALALTLRKKVPLVWSAHQPFDNKVNPSIKKARVAQLAGLLSYFADSIIYVSSEHAKRHYRASHNNKLNVVIPNGIDVEHYYPDVAARKAIRDELKVSDETFLIGKVARYHTQKNHAGFIRAAALLCKERDDVEFVLIGDHLNKYNDEITSQIKSCGIADKIHLLGYRSDINSLNNALDINTLTSISGSFPLAVLEAMATETPCIASSVCGAAYAIADTGMVVEKDNDIAMATAWNTLLNLSPEARSKLGKKARQRCIDYFTLDQQVKGHEALYHTLTRSSSCNDSETLHVY